jgi:hypothetical protein
MGGMLATCTHAADMNSGDVRTMRQTTPHGRRGRTATAIMTSHRSPTMARPHALFSLSILAPRWTRRAPRAPRRASRRTLRRLAPTRELAAFQHHPATSCCHPRHTHDVMKTCKTPYPQSRRHKAARPYPLQHAVAGRSPMCPQRGHAHGSRPSARHLPAQRNARIRAQRTARNHVRPCLRPRMSHVPGHANARVRNPAPVRADVSDGRGDLCPGCARVHECRPHVLTDTAPAPSLPRVERGLLGSSPLPSHSAPPPTLTTPPASTSRWATTQRGGGNP